MNFNTWLQSRLTAHGFPVGAIDGKIGAITTSAIGNFQAARGLPVTNRADDATIAALRLTSNPTPTLVIDGRDNWPVQDDCMAFYGPVGTDQVLVTLPYPMRLSWALDSWIGRISLHRKVADSAADCLDRVAETYSPAERSDLGLDIFGGSLNVRRMRGGSGYSMHSWGIAIDFDPVRNQLTWGKDRARLAQPDAADFWAIWERAGWVSLGRSRNYDWMHVQAARI